MSSSAHYGPLEPHPSDTTTTTTTDMPPHRPSTVAAAAAAAASAASAASATAQPLTLVVATTPIITSSNPSRTRLGIGHNGNLPWPRIKSDMGFFARVTTRPPPMANVNVNTTTTTGSTKVVQTSVSAPDVINAVVMGRKTYDSLPARFRPLPKRLNVVITRDASGDVQRRVVAEWRAARQRERERELEKMTKIQGEMMPMEGVGGSTTLERVEDAAGEEQPDVMVSNSLEDALRELGQKYPPAPSSSVPGKLGGIFVIGGGEIYSSTLRLNPETVPGYKIRLIVTDVRRRQSQQDETAAASAPAYDPGKEVNGFECSTFFPLDMDDIEGSQGWRKAEPCEVTQWVGEEVTGEWKWEGDIAIRLCGYEKVPSSA